MRRIRVVLDTNVIVSAHLKSDGYERHVLDLVVAGKLQLCASEDIFLEYETVLRRKKFGLSAKLVADFMRLIRKTSRLVAPSETVQEAADPDDNKFLECALTADASYIVTGNKRHFPRAFRGVQVLNSRELIELIVPELSR